MTNIESNSDNMCCPLCRGDNSELFGKSSSVYAKKPYFLALCRDCSHVYISNLPLETELNQIYSETYNYTAHLEIADEKKWRIRNTLSELKQFIPKHARIIDVGCMYGFFLEELKRLGYENLLGIEIGKQAVEKSRKKGFKVFEGTFEKWAEENPQKPENIPVCIVLSHVIEHIVDVNDYIKKLNTYLKIGDCLVVFVPNIKSLTARLFGNKWGWSQAPVHIHHFSQTSLSKLFENNGFYVDKAFKRGADSLFWLLIISSYLGLKSTKNELSYLQKTAIRIASFVLKWWYYLGEEELVFVFRKK